MGGKDGTTGVTNGGEFWVVIEGEEEHGWDAGLHV